MTIQIETLNRDYYFLSGDHSFKANLLSCDFPEKKSLEEVIEQFNEDQKVKITLDMLPISQQRFYISWGIIKTNPEQLSLLISVNDYRYHIYGESKGEPNQLVINNCNSEVVYELNAMDWELVIAREMPFVKVDFIKQLILV